MHICLFIGKFRKMLIKSFINLLKNQFPPITVHAKYNTIQYSLIYWAPFDEPPYLCLVVAAGPPPHWCQPPWCGVVVASFLGSGWSQLNRHLLPMWHALVLEALHLYSPKIQRHWINFAWINSFGNFIIIYNGNWGKFHTHPFPIKSLHNI